MQRFQICEAEDGLEDVRSIPPLPQDRDGGDARRPHPPHDVVSGSVRLDGDDPLRPNLSAGDVWNEIPNSGQERGLGEEAHPSLREGDEDVPLPQAEETKG